MEEEEEERENQAGGLWDASGSFGTPDLQMPCLLTFTEYQNHLGSLKFFQRYDYAFLVGTLSMNTRKVLRNVLAITNLAPLSLLMHITHCSLLAACILYLCN